LISQGVPQLGASNNIDMAKTSLHTHGCCTLTWL